MSKLQKGLLIAGTILVVIILGVSFLIISINKKMTAYNAFEFANLDLSTVDDGIYTGSEDASIVKATVEVTIKDHTITAINIISHDNGRGKPAEVIVDDIIENNSTNVDAISGATLSSHVIKMAVYHALTK